MVKVTRMDKDITTRNQAFLDEGVMHEMSVRYMDNTNSASLWVLFVTDLMYSGHHLMLVHKEHNTKKHAEYACLTLKLHLSDLVVDFLVASDFVVESTTTSTTCRSLSETKSSTKLDKWSLSTTVQKQ